MLLLPHAGGLSRLLTILYMSITGMLRKNNVKLYKYGIDWGMALASLFIPSFWCVARRGIVRGSEESISLRAFLWGSWELLPYRSRELYTLHSAREKGIMISRILLYRDVLL